MARKNLNTTVAAVSPVVTEMTMEACFGPEVKSAEQIEMERQAAAISELEAAFGPLVITAKAEVTTEFKGEGVCALIKNMLVTTATYHEIITEVYNRFPNAKTTAKSIASIARDMRKAGIAVAKR